MAKSKSIEGRKDRQEQFAKTDGHCQTGMPSPKPKNLANPFKNLAKTWQNFSKTWQKTRHV